MIKQLPFKLGCFAGRFVALPVFAVGFLVYSGTASLRKLKKHVKSIIKFVLSLIFFITVFLSSLALLSAAKEVEYDLGALVPVQVRTFISAISGRISESRSSGWFVSALSYVEEHASFISNATVAILLVPLFTNGVQAFLATLRWVILFLPNLLSGFFWGFCGSFEYILCAISITNHRKHPDW
jgi:hypothetical protein